MITLEIEDSGMGIKEDLAKKLFKMFDNMKFKNIVNSGGCGFGLTLCKKLCDMQKFNLSFTSKENEGSTFKVVIVR